MPPHSIGSGTVSFGLVSIPIKMYTAASSGGVSFNQLHVKCGNRIKMQQFCPVCNEVVDRALDGLGPGVGIGEERPPTGRRPARVAEARGLGRVYEARGGRGARQFAD